MVYLDAKAAEVQRREQTTGDDKAKVFHYNTGEGEAR